jgi:hypothetical protein
MLWLATSPTLDARVLILHLEEKGWQFGCRQKQLLLSVLNVLIAYLWLFTQA